VLIHIVRAALQFFGKRGKESKQFAVGLCNREIAKKKNGISSFSLPVDEKKSLQNFKHRAAIPSETPF
jgi:hypothetical protein